MKIQNYDSKYESLKKNARLKNGLGRKKKRSSFGASRVFDYLGEYREQGIYLFGNNYKNKRK